MNGPETTADRLEDGQVRNALGAGVDVRGSFVWSLMDDSGWACGHEKRFGLVDVDDATQERVLKDSARWYGQFLG